MPLQFPARLPAVLSHNLGIFTPQLGRAVPATPHALGDPRPSQVSGVRNNSGRLQRISVVVRWALGRGWPGGGGPEGAAPRTGPDGRALARAGAGCVFGHMAAAATLSGNDEKKTIVRRRSVVAWCACGRLKGCRQRCCELRQKPVQS